MLDSWQMAWDDGDTGRFIHYIIPKVSLQPINWTRNEVLFFTAHGPFPSFLQRFNLAESLFCSRGGISTPIHYATVCLLTISYHMAPPNQHQPIWFRSVANNSTSLSPKRNQPFPSRTQIIVFFFFLSFNSLLS
ncbi:hypothetical protein AVEN_197839-1 [Araneus ventricosus]|uniref:Uncharacterized protein n=1 Tax=Araneus ventricosus TaxID=182803 RepID=A0A4Y2N245_ARAVE|nr:hypothetical protein AVEN_197839-1 [Araneus ventricosus]